MRLLARRWTRRPSLSRRGLASSNPRSLRCTRRSSEHVISCHTRRYCNADGGQDVEEEEKPEGFWRELFLLKPDLPRLRDMLETSEAGFLLHVQHQSQQLVRHAIAHVKAGHGPADENALDVSAVPRLAVEVSLDL